LAKKYSSDALGDLGDVVAEIIYKNGAEDDFGFLFNHYRNQPATQDKIMSSVAFAKYLSALKNKENVKKSVDEIMKFRNQIPAQYHSYIDPTFKNAFSKISQAQRANGNTDLAAYIDGLLK
jgi:hypothetical protein